MEWQTEFGQTEFGQTEFGQTEFGQIEFGQMEFAVFCIENVATRLHIDASVVYKALTEQSHILTSYIIPNYEILHTQGKEYIVDDIIDVMREEGVCA